MLQDIDSEGPEPSDWDKYASEEYEILVAEETANEQLHEGYDPALLLLILNEIIGIHPFSDGGNTFFTF